MRCPPRTQQPTAAAAPPAAGPSPLPCCAALCRRRSPGGRGSKLRRPGQRQGFGEAQTRVVASAALLGAPHPCPVPSAARSGADAPRPAHGVSPCSLPPPHHQSGPQSLSSTTQHPLRTCPAQRAQRAAQQAVPTLQASPPQRSWLRPRFSPSLPLPLFLFMRCRMVASDRDSCTQAPWFSTQLYRPLTVRPLCLLEPHCVHGPGAARHGLFSQPMDVPLVLS